MPVPPPVVPPPVVPPPFVPPPVGYEIGSFFEQLVPRKIINEIRSIFFIIN